MAGWHRGGATAAAAAAQRGERLVGEGGRWSWEGWGSPRSCSSQPPWLAAGPGQQDPGPPRAPLRGRSVRTVHLALRLRPGRLLPPPAPAAAACTAFLPPVPTLRAPPPPPPNLQLPDWPLAAAAAGKGSPGLGAPRAEKEKRPVSLWRGGAGVGGGGSQETRAARRSLDEK